MDPTVCPTTTTTTTEEAKWFLSINFYYCLVEVDHSNFRTLASETVDPINWPLTSNPLEGSSPWAFKVRIQYFETVHICAPQIKVSRKMIEPDTSSTRVKVSETFVWLLWMRILNVLRRQVFIVSSVSFRSKTPVSLHLPVTVVAAEGVLGLLRDQKFPCSVHLPAKFAPEEPLLEELKKSYAKFNCSLTFDL